MDERRRNRLSGDIRNAITELLSGAASDPRLQYVHITRVKLSRDASHATVFFETTGSAKEREDACGSMKSAAGFIRRGIASRMRLRIVPALSLVHDTSGEEGDRVLGIMREI